MIKSTFGKNIKVTVFGGSHEEKIGVRIEGLTKEQRAFDRAELQRFLDLRAPGNSPFATARKESDEFESEEDGEGLVLTIKNRDQRSGDYKKLVDVPRPGHADLTARYRYGDDLNMAGGGPFSGRMTAPLCMAGGIALQELAGEGIKIGAHIAQIGAVRDDAFDPMRPEIDEVKGMEPGGFPVLSEDAAQAMKKAINQVREDGDSLGGIIEVAATGVECGLGGAMYDGLEGALASVYFGIPAVKAVEFGAGFAAAKMCGSENNDAFKICEGTEDTSAKVVTKTNNAGGILGGITTGMPLIARIGFKPTPSIRKMQESVNLKNMKDEKLSVPGRHDPCVAVRAVPVCIAATAIVLLDMKMERSGGSK